MAKCKNTSVIFQGDDSFFSRRLSRKLKLETWNIDLQRNISYGIISTISNANLTD